MYAKRIFLYCSFINPNFPLMKLKSAFYLLPLLIFPLSSFSQSGYIEVEVSESVVLKPLSFEYALTVGNDYDLDAVAEEATETEYDEDINLVKRKANQKKKLNELENFLKLKKYSYTPLDASMEVNKLDIFGSSEGFKVKVNSVEALQKLVAEIKDMKHIDGAIAETTFEDSAAHDAPLLKKIIEKAKSEAQAIAAGTNLTLGKIIEVKEIQESQNSNQNFIDLMKELSSRRYTWGKLTLNKVYSKGYVIKFKAD